MIDWSVNGHKLPQSAVRNSDNLQVVAQVKARECRRAWERAEAGLEPFHVIVSRVVEKARNANRD